MQVIGTHVFKRTVAKQYPGLLETLEQRKYFVHVFVEQWVDSKIYVMTLNRFLSDQIEEKMVRLTYFFH